MVNPSLAWQADHPWGAVYDFLVEREGLARVTGRLALDTDTRLLYRCIDAVGDLPDGSQVLDIPCGGGVALRGVRPEQRLHYIAADISTSMLQRTRRAARARGLDVQTTVADVEHLPFEDGRFDLAVSFAGLHCFPRPHAAVMEVGRCLRRGGRFVGSLLLTGTGVRHRATIIGGRLAGLVGPSGSRDDLQRWLAEAGLVDIHIQVSGAVGYFSAQRPER